MTPLVFLSVSLSLLPGALVALAFHPYFSGSEFVRITNSCVFVIIALSSVISAAIVADLKSLPRQRRLIRLGAAAVANGVLAALVVLAALSVLLQGITVRAVVIVAGSVIALSAAITILVSRRLRGGLVALSVYIARIFVLSAAVLATSICAFRFGLGFEGFQQVCVYIIGYYLAMILIVMSSRTFERWVSQ